MTIPETDERGMRSDEDEARRALESGSRPIGEIATQREETVIPVAREELEVQKRRVETDRGVRVRKTVQEREVVVDEPLEKDEVQVQRVRIGRQVEAAPDVRYEGETMIIPVVEEVLVVERRLMLQEEIRVTRLHHQVRSPQRVVLRTEHAAVERIESGEVIDSPDVRDRGAPADAECPPVMPMETGGDDSLIERKRRQTELRRGLLASEGGEEPERR